MELSTVLLILLILGAINYISMIARDRVVPQLIADPGAFIQREGFTGDTKAVEPKENKEVFLKNNELYDDFYASVYDQLTSNGRVTQAKVALLLNTWKREGGMAPEDMIVADAGSGTGMAAVSFAKMNVKKVIAIDKSSAMLARAKDTTLTQAKLTDKQSEAIEFRNTDLLSPSALGGSSVTNMAALYFTIYYLRDIDAFFRNAFLWVKPGGYLSVEVVNKYKFDPMLESASPWVGFSLQKYTTDRITESKVTFDKFDYSGKFDLTDPEAEFRETFRFKDGRVRRQKHTFHMPNITEIVKSAQAAGWKYTKFIDLTVVGFEYSFLLMFRHP
jgi:ubiquinone/menaquinone biosynthesis C-methylase UbiE